MSGGVVIPGTPGRRKTALPPPDLTSPFPPKQPPPPDPRGFRIARPMLGASQFPLDKPFVSPWARVCRRGLAHAGAWPPQSSITGRRADRTTPSFCPNSANAHLMLPRCPPAGAFLISPTCPNVHRLPGQAGGSCCSFCCGKTADFGCGFRIWKSHRHPAKRRRSATVPLFVTLPPRNPPLAADAWTMNRLWVGAAIFLLLHLLIQNEEWKVSAS